MKDFRYANRGSSLEGLIEYANKIYRQKGLAIIEKQYVEMLPIRDGHGKVVACKVGEKSTVDYMGRVGSIPIAIEAKNTNEDTIRFDRIQEHQSQFLDDFTKGGAGLGFVLLSFNLKRFFLLPWTPFYQSAYDLRVRKKDRKTPLTVEAYGITWEIPKKASFRIEEIPPEFEVDLFDPKYSLHYLKQAFRYITPNMQFKKSEK